MVIMHARIDKFPVLSGILEVSWQKAMSCGQSVPDENQQGY